MGENSMWMRRPNVREGDEDLMNLRNQFSREGYRPAATLVSKGNENNSCLKTSEQTVKKTLDLSNRPPEVLFDIVERDVVGCNFLSPINMQQKYPPMKFNPKNSFAKKSIFLQHIDSLKLKDPTPQKVQFAAKAESASLQCPQSFILNGSGLDSVIGYEEIQNIHDENLQKISSMSTEEIKQHQKELLSSLSKDTIQFLRSRRKNTNFTFIPESSVQCKSSVKRSTLSDDPKEIILKDMGGQDRDAILLEDICDDILEPREAKEQSKEEIALDELPINPNDVGHWIHMNTVEKEKLAWMTLLPKPVDDNTGHSARFDFEGNLLSRALDVPTQMGLHHHSHEPEVAGYSVEELFILARSSTQAQRSTALQILASILENYWDGRYDGCFNTSLLETLLQAGLVPILRWALDNNNLSSLATAVLALHRLLICKSDELCLDRAFCWLRGHVTPFLIGKNSEDSVNVEELTDANLVQLDIIKGLLRMDILPRFRWILWKLCPPPAVCQLIIEICIRISRHSSQSAKQVAEFPYLLSVIFKKFLPTSYGYHSKSSNTENLVVPLTCAIKLLRVICASDRNNAEYLMTHHNVFDVLECYLTIDPSDGKLLPADVQKLMVESLRLWQTLLCYGFCTDILARLLPMLRRQFLFCQSVSINTDIEKNIPNYDYVSHFFKACEAAIGAVSNFCTKYKNDEFRQKCLTTWEDIVPFAEVALVCTKRWLHEFSVQPPNWSGQIALASCLNFLSVFFTESVTKKITCCSLLESFVKSNLLPFLISKAFVNMVEELRFSSELLCKESSGCQRDSKGLVSLGHVQWLGDVLPMFSESSSIPFVLSVLHFIKIISTSNPTFHKEVAEKLPEIHFDKYLTSIACLKNQPQHHWCLQFELELVMNILEFYKLTNDHNEDLLFKVSLAAIKLIGFPFEVLLKNFLTRFVFNASYFCNKKCFEKTEILNLPSISKFYQHVFIPLQNLEISENLFKPDVDHLAGLSYKMSDSILSTSWILQPLYTFYQEPKSKDSERTATTDILLGVKSILQWMNIIHALGPISSAFGIPSNVQFTYLSMIFLNDSDVYRHEQIGEPLSTALKNILSCDEPLSLADVKWPDIPSFEEIFAELLVEFEASSYGDTLFSMFVTLCLQQCYPSQWKLQILTDHQQALNFLNLSFDQLPVPVENFLEPYETNESLLKKYFKLFATQTISPSKCRLIYLMAVHHIHHFINSSSCPNTEFQTILKDSITRISDKEIQNHILQYVKYDSNSKNGFTLNANV